jgi:signal transduction histidine kinase
MVDVRGPLLVVAVSLGAGAVRAYTDLPTSAWAPDLAVGLAAAGLAGASWRASRATSALSLLLAATWWAGTIWPVALYWHRGVLVHLILAVPQWRPRSGPGVVTMVAGYLAAVAAPVWQSRSGILAAAACLVAGGVLEARTRRRSGPLVGGVVLIGAALVVGFHMPELLGPESGPSAAVLVYDLLLIGVLGAVAILGRSPTHTELTDLAVDLGTAPLRDAETLAGLVKAEPGLAAEADLQAALAAARRLEAANQEVRDRVRDAVIEVDRSRRRLVVAASQERRRLGLELTTTAVTPLYDLLERTARAGLDVPGLSRAAERLDSALLGLRPPALAEGLSSALGRHALVSALEARVEVTDERCDEVVEDTLYAVAVESLANVAKHAGPCRVAVRFAVEGFRAWLTVSDDGVGGAAAGAGSGLAGLTDRLEALGGGLRVSSPPGGGTVVTAWAPRALTEAGRHRPTAGSRPAAP